MSNAPSGVAQGSESPSSWPTLSARNQIVKWLLGQEANTVALYAILMALGYGSWWAVSVGVPSHLNTIQQGYERIADRHDKQRAEDRLFFKETLDRIDRMGK